MMRIRNLPCGRLLLALALVAWLCGGTTQTASAGTLVNFDFTVGTNQRSIQVDMFDDVTPQTVTNFLNYVTSGRYQDTVVHRFATNPDGSPFVIQGGGYSASQFTANPLPNTPAHIAQFASPQNEYQLTNGRVGTIAMARSSGVNSATSEWFFNLNDNSFLNTQNQGFTVFGWIVGDGMSVIQEIEGLTPSRVPFPAYNGLPAANDPFATVPKDSQGNLVVLNNVTISETHPSFQNPIWDADVNNDGHLTVSDIMPIVNGLLAQNGRFTPSKQTVGATYNYSDTSGDGVVSVSDLMRVVNAILRGDTAPASSLAAPLAAPLAIVPEPSTFALITMAVVAVAAIALRRRSRTAA